MFFDKHSSFHHFRTMLKKPVLIGVFAAGLSKLDAICPFEQFEEKIMWENQRFQILSEFEQKIRCFSQKIPTGSTELLSLCPWEKKWGPFWKNIPAIAFEEWASNFRPLALKILAGSSELHSTCLKTDLKRINSSGKLYSFHRFRTLSEKSCPLS